MSWKKFRLGDTATFINGYAFKPTEWASSGYPIIRIQNLTGTSREFNYFEGEIPQKYFVNKGDVLVSWSASLGVYEWEGDTAVLNQHIFKVAIDKIEIDKPFLKFLLLGKIEEMKSAVHGATMKHITKGKFDDIKVKLPDLPTQQHIAAVLDKADTLRQQNQQLLAHYDGLLQSTFIALFGDPVKNEMGWEVKKLGDVCTRIVDCPHSTPNHDSIPTDYPSIRTTELKNGSINWSSMKYVQHNEYLIRTKRLVPVGGDIVYGREGTFGEAVVIPDDTKMCLGQRVMLFRPNYDFCNSIFLLAMVRNDFVYNQAVKKTSGSTVGHVNVKDIKLFDIILPPLSLQNHFAEIVEKIEAQKEQTRTALAESEALFEGLLAGYFGENQIHTKGSNPGPPTSQLKLF